MNHRKKTKADGSRLIPRKHTETLVLLSVLTGFNVESSGSHSMSRDPNKGCDFAEDQKIGRAEAIKT